MDDLRKRLIEAAVRPFADNAELRLSATTLLETWGKAPDHRDLEAIGRWEEVDSHNRKPFLWIALYSILTLVSAVVLTASIRQAVGYQKIAGWFTGDFSGDFPEPETLIGGNLTEDQKLLLFGRSPASSKDARAKPLWDSEPDNPAYFAEYATAYQSEHGELPADFLDTARRLDPDNAWFTYLAAAALAKGSYKEKGSSWEFSNPAKFAAAMALFREARAQPRCDNYRDLMLRKRIPLLPQEDLLENMNSIFAINTISTSSNIQVVHLTFAICANGWQLAENGDSAPFRELLEDWDLLMRRMLDSKNPTLLTEHEIIARLGSIVTWTFLLAALAAVAVYRFRSPALIRRLAARMASLLRPSDWIWLLTAGVVLPFCYFMAITRLTPLGGRDFSLTKNDLKLFPDTVVPLALAQFSGLALLLILVPLLVTRRRLAIRGVAFGFTNGKSWPGFAAVVCAAAFIPVIGWVVPAGNKSHVHLAYGLLAIPALWLLGVAFRSLPGGPARLLHSSSAARVLVPAYAAAMLLMISMAPVFRTAECYWFKQDTRMRFDPAFPSLFRYEYEVSQQARRELSQAMGYGGS